MPYRFYFRNEAEDISFQCDTACERCVGRKADQTRCSRTTCKYLPMCHQHLRKHMGLKVAESDIPGAGQGLFTTWPRKAGDKIVPYVGEDLTPAESDARYGEHATHPYTLEHAPDELTDAACRRGTGAFANHKPLSRANCRFSRGRDGVTWIVAVKRIREGSELTVSYGPRYRLVQPGVSHRTVPARRRRSLA